MHAWIVDVSFVIKPIVFRLVFLWLMLWLCPGALHAAVVLQYHHISDSTPAATSTSPERFRRHLDYLARHQFRVLPLPELVAKLRKGEPLPDKAVAITFDDGYRSLYETAFPLLKARNWPFTVFINTLPHDQRLSNFLSWSQLQLMAEQGATIANHTHSHPHLLRRLPGESGSQWRQRIRGEITTAENRIREQLGVSHRLLAYPYGEYDSSLLSLLREMDFAAFGQHSGPLASYSHLQALPRFPFGGRYGDDDDFALKVQSLEFPLVERPTPPAMVLSGRAPQPLLRLHLDKRLPPERVHCFASGQGEISVVQRSYWIEVRAPAPIPVGRSRYNCTAASSEPGRFYWFSQLWMRKRDDGSWYPES